ncbi:MAG: glutamate synthase subunit beta [Sulfurovum sp.]|nr:glutamate synthase subunit beta [Sulfurovum sp.]
MKNVLKEKYAKIERKIQVKRDATSRISDFKPIYKEFTFTEAKAQSDRCLQCPIEPFYGLHSNIEFCRTGCPLHNDTLGWIKHTRENEVKNAFELSNILSPFPEVLGRVCPQDSLCQGSCTLSKTEFGSVTIGGIEVYLNEEAFEKGLKPYYGEDKAKSGKKVAIIGSGPAGMSCATFLLREGIEVEIFEKADRAGGLLTYGIPNFKIDKDVIQRRYDWMIEAGLKVHLNSEITDEEQMQELLNSFDVVFVGVGAPSGRKSGMKNEEAKGVYQVMDILTHIQKNVFESFYDSILQDKNIVVVGGGDSAMDALRASIRIGAKSVKCLYRRDEENMPGSKKELVNAREEGVEFQFLVSPKEITIDDDDNVTGIVCQKTELTEPDSSGRRKLNIIEGSEHTIPCDIIVLALGFDNVKFPWFDSAGIVTGKWNDISVDKDKRTSNAKIFSGGDAVRGADLAVTSALDGRTAAYAIIKDFGL